MIRKGLAMLATCLAFWLPLAPVALAQERAQKAAEIRSPSYVLMDAASGQVMMARNEHEPRPPASISKIMTLLLVFEALKQGRIGLDDVVVGSEYAKSVGGSTIFLDAGEEMTVKELILGVALASGNDASVALAEYLAGTEAKFVELMNEKARQIGMANTRFKNSHGLDEEGHLMSAFDTALLSRYVVQNTPEILEYTRIYDGGFLREGTDRKFQLWNTNKLVIWYDGCDGIKTGSTDRAGFGIAATARRGDTRMIAVVMGAPDSSTRFGDAIRLLNYGFANFTTVPLARKGDVETQARVYKGKGFTVDLVVPSNFAVTVPKGEEKLLQKKVEAPRELVAPVRKGEKIGEIVVTKGDRVIARQDLVAGSDVARAPAHLIWWRTMLGIFALSG